MAFKYEFRVVVKWTLVEENDFKLQLLKEPVHLLCTGCIHHVRSGFRTVLLGWTECRVQNSAAAQLLAAQQMLTVL